MGNMICPKCGQFQEKEEICRACGVVIAKVKQTFSSSTSIERDRDVQIEIYDSLGTKIKQRLFLIDKKQDLVSVFFRGIVLLGIVFLSFKLITSTIASNHAGEIFLHTINLPFHEAGHIVFRPFGSFMTYLGGTLGQFIIPGICFYAFLFQNSNPFGAAVCLWWIGENFLDIAPYINDARAGGPSTTRW